MKVRLTWRRLNAQCGIATAEHKAISMQELSQKNSNVIRIIIWYWFCFPHWKKNVKNIFYGSWQRMESILLAFSNNLNIHVFQTLWIMLGNKVMWQWGRQMCLSCESFHVVAINLQNHQFFVTRFDETSAWIGQEIAVITFLEVLKILSWLFDFSLDDSVMLRILEDIGQLKNFRRIFY